MPRLDRIYTKTGDEGMTGLGGGQRVAKDSIRVETYGTVDELHSQIGVALATGLSARLATELPAIQNQLFDLGSDLATPATSQARHPVPTVQERHIEALERLIEVAVLLDAHDAAVADRLVQDVLVVGHGGLPHRLANERLTLLLDLSEFA